MIISYCDEAMNIAFHLTFPLTEKKKWVSQGLNKRNYQLNKKRTTYKTDLDEMKAIE